VAIVDFWGLRRPILLDSVDQPVSPGDYILNHVGFAIRRIPPEEIGETLALYEQLLREAGDDVMVADVRSEIRATGGETDHGDG
jgi:hydrogenase expression/formation protein HypC